MPSPFATANVSGNVNPLAQQTQQPAQPTGNPLNPQTQQQQPTPPSVPGLPTSTNQPTTNADPMSSVDNFSDVFDNKPVSTKEGQPVTTDPNNPAPAKEADPTAIDFNKDMPTAEAAKKVFDSRNYFPENATELAEAALKGDAASLMSLIKATVANSATDTTLTSFKLSAANMNNNLENLQTNTANKTKAELRTASILGGLLNKYPVLADPAIKANLQEVTNKFIERRGNKTDADLVNDVAAWASKVYNTGSPVETQETEKRVNWLEGF